MSHTLRRGVLAAGLTAALVLAVPAAASAHVGVSPDRIPAGESTLLTFSFSHGCDDSPTTALRITMPEGIGGVWPSFDRDWSVEIEKTSDGVSAVTFTAAQPVPDELRGTVSMAVIANDQAAAQLAFPVEQRCVAGVNEWTQIPADGEDPHSLVAPAPVVALAPAADADSAHADADSAHAGHAADESEPSPVAATAAASAPALPLVLGGGALAVSMAALVVAIRANRSR